MKISSITFIKSEDVPRSMRNTKSYENVQRILLEMKQAPPGMSLVIEGDFQKYERYALQRNLHKHGAKVSCSLGQQNGKSVMFVKRLTDAEWRDWMGTVPVKGLPSPRPVASSAKGGK
jgi:hypothetical protein